MSSAVTFWRPPFKGNPVEIVVQRVPEAVRREGPALEGTVWVLQTLAGEPAPAGAGGKAVDLQFYADDKRAAGFSGCNRYTGSYALEGLSFQQGDIHDLDPEALGQFDVVLMLGLLYHLENPIDI